MKCFEYIRISLKDEILEDLNSLGSTGWHIVAIIHDDCAILEREVIEENIAKVKEFYRKRS